MPRNRRRGVTAIEYGILCFLIVIALIGILAATGANLKNVFGRVDAAIGTVISSGSGGGSASSPYPSAPSTVFGFVSSNYNSSTNITTSNFADTKSPQDTSDEKTQYGGSVEFDLNANSGPLPIPGPNGYGAAGAFNMPKGTQFQFTSSAWQIRSGTSLVGYSGASAVQNACVTDGGVYTQILSRGVMYCDLSNVSGTTLSNISRSLNSYYAPGQPLI